MGNGLAYSVKEKSSTISLVQQNKVAENWCNHIEHPYEKNKAWETITQACNATGDTDRTVS